MKLTERQIKIRAIFRNYIIDNWVSKTNKTKMFGAFIVVAEEFGITQDQARDEMYQIPSIGWCGPTMPINVWMAKYYKQIANALWDNMPKDKVLALWVKTKKTADRNPKIGVTDKKEHAVINKNKKKLAAIAELHKNMPDRWQKTSWGIVK